jgi:hypothetical protein
MIFRVAQPLIASWPGNNGHSGMAPAPGLDPLLLDSLSADAPVQLLRLVLRAQEPSFTLPLDKLGSEFMQLTGRSWNNMYKKKHGSLFQFVQKHPNVFELNIQEVTLIDLVRTDLGCYIA